MGVDYEVLKEMAIASNEAAIDKRISDKYKSDFADWIKTAPIDLSSEPVKIKKSLSMRISEWMDDFSNKLSIIFGDAKNQ